MLPAPARMRRGAEFAATVRGGSRAGSRCVVVHWRAGPEPLRVGFVVGRSTGTAVTRNLVRRRLRHLVRARLASLPATGSLVVRANPTAAAVGYAALARELDHALARVTTAAA